MYNLNRKINRREFISKGASGIAVARAVLAMKNKDDSCGKPGRILQTLRGRNDFKIL